jgi:hypothetical protein
MAQHGLSAFNLVDWNLIGTAIFNSESGTTTNFFDLNSFNSVVQNLVNVTATANALTLGVRSGVIIPNGDLLFEGGVSLPEVNFEEIEFTGERIGNSGFTQFSVSSLVTGLRLLSAPVGGLTFADGKVIASTAATPLPAALPLFATGIGALGLIGWRRKRKAQVAV